MSDIRKWLQIMENRAPVLSGQPDTDDATIKRDATVMINQECGGGTGRYMHSTPNGAMVDVKGIVKELAHDEFSIPDRDYQEPYQNGNTWNHSSVDEPTTGTMNIRPEFDSGDLVRVDDVYGTSIGPGFGVFVAYGTTGQDCIISFDGEEITVPIENVGSVLEQDAKDNFDDMDNDGNLSPMSFGSENIKIDHNEEEGNMDQRDEFSKWISTVEEALHGENPSADFPADDVPMACDNECDCGSWDCPICFPDEVPDSVVIGEPIEIGQGERHPHERNAFDEFDDEEFEVYGMEEDEGDDVEQENTFVEKPRSGKGVKLGDIVTKTEFRKTGGDDSPLTHGGDNLDEDNFPPDLLPSKTTAGEDEPYMTGFDHINPEEQQSMISSILYMQDMGLGNNSRMYREDELEDMDPDTLKKVYDETLGDEAPIPTEETSTFDTGEAGIESPSNSNPVTSRVPSGVKESKKDSLFSIINNLK